MFAKHTHTHTKTQPIIIESLTQVVALKAKDNSDIDTIAAESVGPERAASFSTAGLVVVLAAHASLADGCVPADSQQSAHKAKQVLGTLLSKIHMTDPSASYEVHGATVGWRYVMEEGGRLNVAVIIEDLPELAKWFKPLGLCPKGAALVEDVLCCLMSEMKLQPKKNRSGKWNKAYINAKSVVQAISFTCQILSDIRSEDLEWYGSGGNHMVTLLLLSCL